MKIIDLYSGVLESPPRKDFGFFEENPEFKFLMPLAKGGGMDGHSFQGWLTSPEARAKRTTAETFSTEAKQVFEKIENSFGGELSGSLSPSRTQYYWAGQSLARYLKDPVNLM